MVTSSVQVPRIGAISPVTVRNRRSAGTMVTSFPGRNNTSGRTRVMLLPVSIVT